MVKVINNSLVLSTIKPEMISLENLKISRVLQTF